MDLVEFNISVPPDMVRDLRASIEAREFASTSEAVRSALRAWRRLRQVDAERVEAISERIRRSIDDPRPSNDRLSSPVDEGRPRSHH